MPTTRRRHLITETDAIAGALDDASTRWPEDRDRRAKLLLHLVEEGHRALLDQQGQRTVARHEAVTRTAGALTGLYGADYLSKLRDDWPA
ncbi:MAG: hypothetical protein ACR2HY_04075 [Acidimicrobiales bacterium]